MIELKELKDIHLTPSITPKNLLVFYRVVREKNRREGKACLAMGRRIQQIELKIIEKKAGK